MLFIAHATSPACIEQLCRQVQVCMDEKKKRRCGRALILEELITNHAIRVHVSLWRKLEEAFQISMQCLNQRLSKRLSLILRTLLQPTLACSSLIELACLFEKWLNTIVLGCRNPNLLGEQRHFNAHPSSKSSTYRPPLQDLEQSNA